MMFDQPPNNPIASSSGVVTLERASTSRKRSMDEPSVEVKRPRYNWYVKLESESSSVASEDDTESVYSIQGYETELIQDTPDTDTKSEYSSSSDVEFEVEYEVDDLSEEEEENPWAEGGSSSGTDDVLAAAGAIAVVVCDTSMEAWPTDGEDSDNSSAGDTELNHTDFWTCVQCKSQNSNPLFRYCQKCFQMRKNLFPPRPRRHRKRQRKAEQPKRTKLSAKQKPPEPAVDSGISSQEFSLGSQESVGYPDSASGSQESASGTDQGLGNASSGTARGIKRRSSSIESKDTIAEGGDSSKRNRTAEVSSTRVDPDEDEQVKAKDLVKIESAEAPVEGQTRKDEKETPNHETFQFAKPKEAEFVKPADIRQQSYPVYDDKNLCIMCESESQNSVFVHAGMGCLCCCYKCAMRTWTTHKKCPACTRKVKNIIRLNKS